MKKWLVSWVDYSISIEEVRDESPRFVIYSDGRRVAKYTELHSYFDSPEEAARARRRAIETRIEALTLTISALQDLLR